MPKKIKKKKKTARRPAKKKKSSARKVPKVKQKKTAKPIGRVIHFYNHIGVAIVKFSVKTRAGTPLRFKGATTDFVDTPKSMQYDHKAIAAAPKGKQIGIKVKKRVREGDLVYKPE